MNDRNDDEAIVENVIGKSVRSTKKKRKNVPCGDVDWKLLGLQCRGRRIQKGWSQRDMAAKHAGISSYQARRIEIGEGDRVLAGSLVAYLIFLNHSWVRGWSSSEEES